MAVNALRKKGAKMSLQEALERVEKLQRLAQSSNEHEAALAASRLKSFDIDAARAPRQEAVNTEGGTKSKGIFSDRTIEILQELPDRPYREVCQLQAEQDPTKTGVNWDELHFELLEKAKKLGVDAIVNIQLNGTISQKILCGTAIKYLNAQELHDIKQQTKLEDDEKARLEELKESRDQNTAPDIG